MLMIRMKTLFKTKPLKTSKYTATFYMTVGNLPTEKRQHN